MTAFRLTLKQSPDERLIASAIGADHLMALRKSDVASAPLSMNSADKDSSTIADWFRVEAVSDPEDEHIIYVDGDLSNFDQVAAAQSRGSLIIDGNVGHELGCAMTGGKVIVHGSAGDRAAAPASGSRAGMRGGRIEIHGDVGDQLGSRMRRGEVFVSGDAGDFVAANMIAGTLMVAGGVGDHLAFGMRRGSILLGMPFQQASSAPQPEACRFTSANPAQTRWMTLLQSPSAKVASDLLQRFRTEKAAVSRGDRAVGGQGEIIWIA